MFKLQSALEFLVTYSFMFIILAVAMAIIFFVALPPSAVVSSRCSGFTGLNCLSAQYFSNDTYNYSIVSFLLSNGQSVPLNITNISVLINGKTAKGYCAPRYLNPGQELTCAANLTGTEPQLTFLQGYYAVNGKYCNYGISYGQPQNCTNQNITYTGSFSLQTSLSRQVVFSVITAKGPAALGLPAYQSINAIPSIPSNYSDLQNGDWPAVIVGKTMSYAFASGNYLGGNYLGYVTKPFPSSTSLLNNAFISCSIPHNSLMSQASTVIFAPIALGMTVNIYTSNAMEVFYKPVSSNTFNSIFSGSAWKNQAATLYSSNVIQLSKGLYQIEVFWSDECGSGLQAFQLNGSVG